MDYFCRLLVTFANSLGPDQARQYVGSDLGPNCLNTLFKKKNLQLTITKLYSSYVFTNYVILLYVLVCIFEMGQLIMVLI